MPITNMKISMKEYKRLVEEDVKKASKNSVYGGLLRNLAELTELTENFSRRDGGGNLVPLTPEAYKLLTDSYRKLSKSCGDFLSDNHGKNRLEKKRLNLVKRLHSCVAKDLESFILTDTTKNMTLSDVVKNARMMKVDLTGKQLGRIGAGQNSRIPLKTSSGKEGFFTKAAYFNYDSAVEEIRNKYSETFSDTIADFLNDADRNEALGSYLSFANTEFEPESEDEYKRNATLNNFIRSLKILGDNRQEEEMRRQLSEDKEYAQKLADFLNDFKKVCLKKDLHELAGIRERNRLDLRNAAMSDVAGLLGLSHLLAKSVPMQIVQGDQVIDGTFMETATGEDVNRLSKDSLMLTADKESFNNPEAIKQMAEMQILDYICGNIDRHCGNLMYKFAKNEEGRTVLIGIQGIDNDTSFGLKPFFDGGGQRLISGEDINVISQSCYETLKNLTPETMKVILADKLEADEIKVAITRMNIVKERIDNNFITIVPDKEWGKGDYTFEKMTNRAIGLFGEMKSVVKIIEEARNDMVDHPLQEVKPIEYTRGKNVYETKEEHFHGMYNKINGFVEMASALRGRHHKDSAEYKSMLTALGQVKRYGDALNEKMTNGQEITAEEYKEFAKKMVQMGIASQEYMDAKSLSQYTDLGKNRFSFAAEMRNLAQENFAVIEKQEEKAPQENMPALSR